jgi:hypothetical protein
VDERVAAVVAALEGHPAVTSVRLVGSRAEGREHELSDWDLHVRTDDFERLAEDLPGLVQPAGPLVQIWDPYSDHDAYMVILPGPTKLDICFFDRQREWSEPYEVRADTLEAIDRHFWDWILWTEQKGRGGKTEQVETSLRNMFERMLRPMGVEAPPETVRGALEAYLGARDRLEREFGLEVPRTLEREVRPVIESC